jgi:di/tricarboxylate transporter
VRSLNVLYGGIVVGVLALIVGLYLLSKGHHWTAYGGIGFGVLFLVAGITALMTARKSLRR